MWWMLPLWLNVLLGLLAILAGLTYAFLTSQFDNWKKKGVKYEPGVPFFGSLMRAMTLKEHMMENLDYIYKKFEGEKFVGFFQGKRASLLVRDPELIKNIIVKDFAHFYDHGFKINEEADPMEAKNLFNLEGHKWKVMRSKLSPTFTSGKIKLMTPLMEEVSQNLQKNLTDLSMSGRAVEMKELSSRFTVDVIGSCAFGINCNSIDNPNSELKVMGKKLIHMDAWRAIKAFIIMFLPEIGIKLRLAFINEELTNFFRRLVKDVMELRKKTKEIRKDFIQLLIELKEKGSVSVDTTEDEKEIKQQNGFALPPQDESQTLTHDDLTAQAVVFFLAGFETSSTLISFSCLELATNPDVQRKLQDDIDRALSNHNGKLTYDALKEMKYLDAVIQESLRKYPPAGNVMRVCTKNYIIPGTNVQIEEGTPVIIPTFSIQNDPKYFPNPEAYDPDRFLEENALHKYQYLHMPFGEGPRQCIGKFKFLHKYLRKLKSDAKQMTYD
ncbi:Hypothetical predicted protein [Cloeon dipterum]|uniref:Cytochrome P450 n=1 Tax=Cloeon dipterum TaxID=197152 RepID=A0A8S1CAR5_9INSE|nr:Hypothetical predicted protein [Cloeon dipterum]